MLVVQSLPVGRRRKIPIAFLVIGLLQETVEREAKLLLRRRAGPPYIGMHLQHRIAIATHIRKSDGAQRALRTVKLDREVHIGNMSGRCGGQRVFCACREEAHGMQRK